MTKLLNGLLVVLGVLLMAADNRRHERAREIPKRTLH